VLAEVGRGTTGLNQMRTVNEVVADLQQRAAVPVEVPVQSELVVQDLLDLGRAEQSGAVAQR